MDNTILFPHELRSPFKLRTGDRFQLQPMGETFRVQHFGLTHVTTINERTQKAKTIFFNSCPEFIIYLTDKIQ
jgi:hypothetical protein